RRGEAVTDTCPANDETLLFPSGVLFVFCLARGRHSTGTPDCAFARWLIASLWPDRMLSDRWRFASCPPDRKPAFACLLHALRRRRRAPAVGSDHQLCRRPYS